MSATPKGVLTRGFGDFTLEHAATGHGDSPAANLGAISLYNNSPAGNPLAVWRILLTTTSLFEFQLQPFKGTVGSPVGAVVPVILGQPVPAGQIYVGTHAQFSPVAMAHIGSQQQFWLFDGGYPLFIIPGGWSLLALMNDSSKTWCADFWWSEMV